MIAGEPLGRVHADGLERATLLIQRCACGILRWPPTALCSRCRSFEYDWAAVSGRGRLFSWTVTHHQPLIGDVAKVPLVIGLVSLQEQDGVTMTGRILTAGSDLTVGLEVEVQYLKEGAQVLACWAPLGSRLSH